MSTSRDIEIDRDKVRAEARKLDGTGLRVWLDRAIDMMPDEAFPELIADYVHLRDVLADDSTRPDLLRTGYRKRASSHRDLLNAFAPGALQPGGYRQKKLLQRTVVAMLPDPLTALRNG